jgi:hypothetical protein
MKLLEKIRNVLPSFDTIWKIGVLATLIWMGQSLRDISEGLYAGDNPPAATESASQENPDGGYRPKPLSCPGDSAVAEQPQV